MCREPGIRLPRQFMLDVNTECQPWKIGLKHTIGGRWPDTN